MTPVLGYVLAAMGRVPARRRRSKAAAARRSKTSRAPRPTQAEARLLRLARELTELARDAGGGQAIPAALQKLAAAWAPSAPLPRDVFHAWVRSRSDKTTALALAWAREQVRLGLQEVVERAPKGTRGRVDADAETLAWLLLAACEAIAHEPPSAVADRVRALLELTGHAPATG